MIPMKPPMHADVSGVNRRASAVPSDEVHKMVKFALRNPKLEFRNPKQIQIPNFQIMKMRRF